MASPKAAIEPVGATDPVIEARGIRKTYSSWLPFRRDETVLRGADLTVGRGEVVGVVGTNGAGKTTLMEILVGVLDKDGGTVDRPETIGWCPQETLLYDRLTVDETFRLFGRGYGLDDDEITERTEWLAEKLGFEGYRDYRVENLSGGNRQKVNLSIALLHDPDLLLLDEPNTGFDWDTYLTFWNFVDDLVGDGVAVTIISHLVEEKERFDRILELREGVVVPKR